MNQLKKTMENKIRIERAIKNITQQQLAEAIGTTRITINLIENNKVNPRLEMSMKIAKHFGRFVHEIFILENDIRKD